MSDDNRRYAVELAEIFADVKTGPGGEAGDERRVIARLVAAEPKIVAAVLRSAADQLDPPQLKAPLYRGRPADAYDLEAMKG